MRGPRKQRAPTRQENILKRTRKFKGVRKRKGGAKWVSEVRVPNSRQRIWVGSYDTPEQAARAYDYAVYYLRGAKANFNFSDFSPPENMLVLSSSHAEIQAAAAKYAVEGSRQPSQKDATLSGNESDNVSPTEIQAAAAKYGVEGFQEPSEEDAASSVNESQSRIDEPLILEEEDPALLDSLLQEFESGETTNVNDLSGQHAPPDDSDLVVVHEEQDKNGVPSSPEHTKFFLLRLH